MDVEPLRWLSSLQTLGVPLKTSANNANSKPFITAHNCVFISRVVFRGGLMN